MLGAEKQNEAGDFWWRVGVTVFKCLGKFSLERTVQERPKGNE